MRCHWQQWKRHLANSEYEFAADAACLLQDVAMTGCHADDFDDLDDDDDDEDVVAAGRFAVWRHRLAMREKMVVAYRHSN